MFRTKREIFGKERFKTISEIILYGIKQKDLDFGLRVK